MCEAPSLLDDSADPDNKGVAAVDKTFNELWEQQQKDSKISDKTGQPSDKNSTTK